VVDWYWYAAYPTKVKVIRVDPGSPEKGKDRVIRGGSWLNNPGYCRSAFRGYLCPTGRYYFMGFRPVAVPQEF
jgi:formylglycine-generating enzyme required for sulfatase activity